MTVYSNLSTSTMDIIFFYFSITEGCFLFLSNFVVAIFIICNKKLSQQKEYVTFAGAMLYNAFFGLGHISSASFRISVYYNEEYIPLFTPWECILFVQNYFWVITIPATGLIVLFCTFDRVISVAFPLRYLKLSLNYTLSLIFAPLVIMVPIYVIGAFDAYSLKDKYVVPAMCNLVNGDMPGIFYSLRFIRMFSSIIAILLYIPIMIKMYYVKNSTAKLHIQQRKKFFRATVTIGLLVSNEFILCVLPDLYLSLYPRWSWIYIFYILILNKGILNLIFTLIIHREIRKVFITSTKKAFRPLIIFSRYTGTASIS